MACDRCGLNLRHETVRDCFTSLLFQNRRLRKQGEKYKKMYEDAKKRENLAKAKLRGLREEAA